MYKIHKRCRNPSRINFSRRTWSIIGKFYLSIKNEHWRTQREIDFTCTLLSHIPSGEKTFYDEPDIRPGASKMNRRIKSVTEAGITRRVGETTRESRQCIYQHEKHRQSIRIPQVFYFFPDARDVENWTKHGWVYVKIRSNSSSFFGRSDCSRVRTTALKSTMPNDRILVILSWGFDIRADRVITDGSWRLKSTNMCTWEEEWGESQGKFLSTDEIGEVK